MKARCATCGGMSSPMRQDDRKQIVCRECFERWRFFSSDEYNRWKIIETDEEAHPCAQGRHMR